MKKIGIIVDSFSGFDKEYFKKNHVYYLPHYVYVNGKEYKDGVNISIKQINKYAKDNAKLRTSMPDIENMNKIFKETSKKYDDVVYLTMGSALSGTYQTAHVTAKSFKNIHVIDNWITSPQMFDMVITKICNLYSKGKKVNEIINVIKKWNEKVFNIIIPVNMTALHNSGRIGKSGTFLLNKAKIIPLLKYNKLVKIKWFKRTQKKAVKKAILILKAYKDTLKEKDLNVYVGYVGDKSITNDAVQTIKSTLEVKEKNIHLFHSPCVVTVHIGYHAISISLAPKI